MSDKLFDSPTKESGNNLLPCPFCGTQPVWAGLAKHLIKCPECDFVMAQDQKDKVIGRWNQRRYQIPVPATSFPNLGQFKDDLAKEHGHKSWATYTGDEGLGRHNREKQLLDKGDELTIRYSSAVSNHERRRAERAEKVNEKMLAALIALKDAVKASGEMNGREYDGLGAEVLSAINAGQRYRATLAEKGGKP